LPEELENLRLQGDPAARQLPAHITIHFPFADEPKSKAVNTELKKLVGRIESFSIQFDSLDHFDMPEEVIYYLRVAVTPELVRLFQTIWRKFPSYPPYEGKYDTIIPHITLSRFPKPVTAETAEQLAMAVNRHRNLLRWDISEVEWINVRRGVPGCRILGTFPLKKKEL
jgi:2'-5' RNA ligase